MLHHHFESEPRFGMPHVKEEILSVDIVDIAIVVIVSPSWRPRIDQDECIAAVLKLRPAGHHLRMMHRKVMLASELRAEAVVRNAAAVSAGAIMTLRTACFLAATFLSSLLFLPARFRPVLFLPVWFLLCRPHVVPGLRLLGTLLLLRPLLALLLRVRRPGFVLPRRFHLILSRCRLGFILPVFRTGLILPRWLLLPRRLFLLRFFFLLFIVLRVNYRRTREQSREKS